MHYRETSVIMLERTSLVWHVLVFALIVAGTALHYRGYFFGPPITEIGDFAANALKISQAKGFDELYGNYSRWKFQHPGPAFFYVFALGEWLLYDLVPAFKSPHQAHAFVNLLLQAAFLTVSFGALARFAGTALFSCLFALAAAVHFRLAPTIFIELWPPNLLVFPMLALIVCAAAVASGARRYIPVMAICSGFLIHGHVAQPLFVVPITGIALFIYLRWQRRDASDRNDWLLAGFITTLFLFPLLMDAAKGADSNLMHIIGHMERHRGESKGVVCAITYLACFFLYVDNPELLTGGGTVSFSSDIAHHLPVLALWALVTIPPAFLLFRKHCPVVIPLAGRRFYRALAGFVALALLLTLKWGQMMDGEMYAFNAFFNYAIILLALAPAVLLPALALKSYSRRLFKPLLVCAGLLLIGLALSPAPLTIAQRQSEPLLPEQVSNALKTTGRSRVLLVFEHPDWIKAAGVAVIMQRAGVPFFVLPRYGFLFGYRHCLDPRLPDPAAGPVSIWEIRSTVAGQTVVEPLPLRQAGG